MFTKRNVNHKAPFFWTYLFKGREPTDIPSRTVKAVTMIIKIIHTLLAPIYYIISVTSALTTIIVSMMCTPSTIRVGQNMNNLMLNLSILLTFGLASLCANSPIFCICLSLIILFLLTNLFLCLMLLLGFAIISFSSYCCHYFWFSMYIIIIFSIFRTCC